MGLIHVLIILTLILVSQCIQFEVPEVKDIVGEIIDEYKEYVHYNGSDIEAPAPALAIQGAVSDLQSRQAASYWYEQIPHQGISAFGPAGYQVYRNVKDYGARGIYIQLHRLWTIY
jgi:glucan 1,3-beta-glucosidase